MRVLTVKADQGQSWVHERSVLKTKIDSVQVTAIVPECERNELVTKQKRRQASLSPELDKYNRVYISSIQIVLPLSHKSDHPTLKIIELISPLQAVAVTHLHEDS